MTESRKRSLAAKRPNAKETIAALRAKMKNLHRTIRTLGERVKELRDQCRRGPGDPTRFKNALEAITAVWIGGSMSDPALAKKAFLIAVKTLEAK